MTREELLRFIKKEIATETGTQVETIDENASFHSLGLDSLSAVLILYNIEKEFGIELNPIHFWDYPTPASFADFAANAQSR
ncbi:MAG TPA: acyl carrier protein [Cyclobacteriaceae bacterium]|nr:acyl carrier protein [Cyclobacteriaceae bacterium]